MSTWKCKCDNINYNSNDKCPACNDTIIATIRCNEYLEKIKQIDRTCNLMVWQCSDLSCCTFNIMDEEKFNNTIDKNCETCGKLYNSDNKIFGLYSDEVVKNCDIPWWDCKLCHHRNFLELMFCGRCGIKHKK